MKTLSINKPAVFMSLLMIAMTVSPVVHSQGSESGKFTGFEQGEHRGHDNEKGLRKGLDNENNPWSSQEDGIDFDVTITNHAIIPNVTVTLTYNSMTKVGEVLADVIGGSTEGFIMQDCYESGNILNPVSDCPEGQSPVQLDVNLTLEAAGLVENPKAHILHIH